MADIPVAQFLEAVVERAGRYNEAHFISSMV